MISGSMRAASRLLTMSLGAAAPLASVAAQPVFDGTTGGQVAGSVTTDMIDVSQGTRAGGNVFHSFWSFSIAAGQTVIFADQNPTTPVNNIIGQNGVVMGASSVVDVLSTDDELSFDNVGPSNRLSANPTVRSAIPRSLGLSGDTVGI